MAVSSGVDMFLASDKPAPRSSSGRSGLARWFLGVFSVAVLSTACDPVLRYSVPGAKIARADGSRYVLSVADGIEAQFQAGIFTVNGETEVQVVNNSPAPVEFQPTPTVLVGADGVRLPTTCELPAEPKVSIATGQTLTVRCKFEGRVRGFAHEPEFQSLSVLQPGFSTKGKALDIAASMRKL